MKYSTTCVVFAALAAAAAPVRADSPIATAVSALNETFFRLIKAETLIRAVEKRNYEFLTPTLSEITLQLQQGLDSGVFQTGYAIRNALVDVNLHVAQISGNATSMMSQIESVAHTFSTLQFSDAGLDYNIKKTRIKKLCEDTLAMTKVCERLIDDTQVILGKNVSGPLQTLQLMVQLAAFKQQDKLEDNIQQQQRKVDNPFSNIWKPFTGFDVKAAARQLQEKGRDTIKRISEIVTSLDKYIKWLEDQCHTIKEDMDSDRMIVSQIEGSVAGSKTSLTTITEGFDTFFAYSRNMSDAYLREGSVAIVKLATDLRDQVSNATRNRTRRAVGPDEYRATEHYQTATKVFPLTIFLETVKPSWLDKTPVNRCFYIYNNRTTGCIYVETFEYMKVQYTWLSNKFIKYEALFKAYEKSLNNLGSQVLNVSKNTSHQSEAIRLVADLETSKLLWSDDIKKIRDLSVSLNSHAESLFSEANAQLKITRSNDATLNEDLMRVVDDKKKTAMNIIKEIENDIFVIKNQAAGIRSRFQKLCPLFQE